MYNQYERTYIDHLSSWMHSNHLTIVTFLTLNLHTYSAGSSSRLEVEQMPRSVPRTIRNKKISILSLNYSFDTKSVFVGKCNTSLSDGQRHIDYDLRSSNNTVYHHILLIDIGAQLTCWKTTTKPQVQRIGFPLASCPLHITFLCRALSAYRASNLILYWL